jgi:hypothetical protein
MNKRGLLSEKFSRRAFLNRSAEALGTVRVAGTVVPCGRVSGPKNSADGLEGAHTLETM